MFIFSIKGGVIPVKLYACLKHVLDVDDRPYIPVAD